MLYVAVVYSYVKDVYKIVNSMKCDESFWWKFLCLHEKLNRTDLI